MTERTLLHVRGMHCQACARRIDQALRRVPGVSAVTVDLDSGEVRVERDPAGGPAESLLQAIVQEGYEVDP